MGCHGDLLSSVEIATLTSVTILATVTLKYFLQGLSINILENYYQTMWRINTQMHRFWNFSLSVKLLNIPPVRYQFEHQILKS